MQSILFWPALALIAGAACTVPAVQDGGSRAVLYWLVLPSLFVGVAAIFSHFGGF
jgi:hypothetical protein